MPTKVPTETLSSYKLVSEIVAALNQRIDDADLQQVPGSGGKMFSYVPWDTSLRLLTEIFGVFGWSERIIDRHSDTERGIYSVAVEITAFAIDDSTGTVVSFTRPGVGRSVATSTRDGSLQHDTAIAAAESDALSRAAKKFGPALGSILYDKADPARSPAPQQASQSAHAQPSGDLGFRPSPAQMNVLTKYRGLTAEQVNAMPFAQWKALMDNKAPAGRVSAPIADPEEEDYTF